MEVKGLITIFPEHKTAGEKEITLIRTSISTKREDGSYANKSIFVKLAPKTFPVEKVAMLKDDECYQLEIEEGFLSVEEWPLKNGKTAREISIVVLAGKLKGHKKYVKKVVEEVVDSELPF